MSLPVTGKAEFVCVHPGRGQRVGSGSAHHPHGSLGMLQEPGTGSVPPCLPGCPPGKLLSPSGWARAAGRAGELQPCPSKAGSQLERVG